MGSCVSVDKVPESTVKLPFSIESKNDKVLLPSPVKERTDLVNAGDRPVGDVAVKSHLSPTRFVDAGSKDEAFFDSQPWLDSDCEDEFLSVNGDFTPSRGNTPVHHSFSPGNPRSSNARLMEQTILSSNTRLMEQTVGSSNARLMEQTIGSSTPEPSPPDKKKRLSELFKESLRSNEYADVEAKADNQNGAPSKVVPVSTSLIRRQKSTNGTPYLSRTSSERTPYGEHGEEDNKAFRSGQCCLPRLILSQSFNERKQRMSPAQKLG